MDSEWELSLAVVTMNDADYLKSQRMTDSEREEWSNYIHSKYEIPSVSEQKPFNANDLYEAHAHHEESHYGGSH